MDAEDLLPADLTLAALVGGVSHPFPVGRDLRVHFVGRTLQERLRLASVRALESIRDAKSRSAIERLAKQDLDQEVRAAAKAALPTLPGF